MSIEVDLYEYLSNNTAIKSKVEDRIYPVLAKKGVKTPYITYINVNDMDLTSAQGENYANVTRFQVDIFSETYSQGKTILGAVKEALYQFKHTPHDFSSRDMHEQDTKLYRQLIEFKFINKG